MTSDNIADMLTRIRNAQAARHTRVSLPYSKIKEGIAKILSEAGFVGEVKVEKNGTFQQLLIELEGPGHITELQRVSKPGRRVYASSQDIPLVLGGRGLVVLSTS